MPLEAVITGANANDGCQTAVLFHSLVVRPPAAERCIASVESRDLPRAQAEGAYGNWPTQEWAQRVGIRLRAPKRGEARPGVGKIRNAVECYHDFFPNAIRVFRRFDRLTYWRITSSLPCRPTVLRKDPLD